MKAIKAAHIRMTPKNALDHLMSSAVLETGGGSALASFLSSMSYAAMRSQSYAGSGAHAT